ncbi:hypothetical protein [Paucilactobacillus vaccinostercus]|uniref:hypothetical protein n=1 Tax=Paucilactobacillus vaccinostercus TaxID=176291 RepID=UPI00070F3BE7|nr:hypothetical protein [Paucilactobacillus vaccinostercus]
MDRIKFEIIRTVEKLSINLNHQHDYREYEVVIQINEDNAYEVFATDERVFTVLQMFLNQKRLLSRMQLIGHGQ